MRVGARRLRQTSVTLPVLKHGPRSLARVRVCAHEARGRNESNGLEVFFYCPTDRLRLPRKGLRIRTRVRTRKMVNYA